MTSQSEILSYLRSNKQKFSEEFGIQKVGLFGSFARNEQTENSDIDILIEMQDGEEDMFGKRLDFREILQHQFSRNVDVCHAKAIRSVFREMIFKEVIYA